MQEKLLPAMADHERLIARVGALLETARDLSVPVIASEQYPRGLGPTVPSLKEKLGDGSRIHAKLAFSCVGEPAIADSLQALGRQGRRQVIVAGVESHVCVMQSALALQALEFDTFVVADAVGSRREDDREAALHRLRDEGVRIVTTEMVLFEWLRSADSPAFKAVSGRVKQLFLPSLREGFA